MNGDDGCGRLRAKKNGEEKGKGKLTLIRLRDLLLALDIDRLARILDDERHLLAVVEPNVRITYEVHGERVRPGLRRRGELQLERLHLERRLGRVASGLEDGLVEGAEGAGRHGDAELLVLAEQ